MPRRRQSQSKLDKYKKYAYYVLFTDGRVNKRRRGRSWEKKGSKEGNKKNESLTVIGMGLKDELLRLLRGIKRTFNCKSSDLWPPSKAKQQSCCLITRNEL